MKDILLDKEGDIALNQDGDITMTDSVIQAVMIKIRWFFEEWVYDPELGIPYFESVFIKNPDLEEIEEILTEQILEIEEVTDVADMEITVDSNTRTADVTFTIETEEGVYTREVELRG